MLKSIATNLALTLALTLATVPAVQSGPVSAENGSPDRTDLLIYVLCSDTALERPLSMAEAVACGRIFDRLKLAFVTDVTLEEYIDLPTREQHAINLVGYGRFRAWYDANPEAIEAVRAEIHTFTAVSPNREDG